MRRNLQTLALSLVLALAAACAGSDINDNDPKELFKEAEEDIEGDRYMLALEKLRIVKNKFPYSKYSVKSKLRIADVYFLQEMFIEAAASYELFRELHPKHVQAPYALYRTGESYMKSLPSTIARDHTSASRAVEAFQTFTKQYPRHKDSKKAKEALAQARRKLAEKELYIADFYYVRDHYHSAFTRYKKIVRFFPGTDSARSARSKIDEIEKDDLLAEEKEESEAKFNPQIGQ